jgi:hypothetical protein
MGVINLHRILLPCDIAVETGTCLGESTARLAVAYSLVHTIELSPSLHRQAVQRFSQLPHVHCHHGNSPEVLARLVPELEGSVLFFLDAHFSGDAHTVWRGFRGYGVDTARSTVPLLEELDVIVRLCRGRCVVYIDDMDKLDARGHGLRDKGFLGEDWSHITLKAIYDILAPRIIRSFGFDDQLVFHLAALDETPRATTPSTTDSPLEDLEEDAF